MKSFFRDPKMLSGALVVSLSVNLFIAGFFAARLFKQAPEPRPFPVAALTRMSDFLPEQRRAEIREEMIETRARIAESMAKMRAANFNLAELLGSELYDNDELEEALNEVRALNSETQRAVHDFVITVAPRISPEDRRKMMMRWSMRHRHRD